MNAPPTPQWVDDAVLPGYQYAPIALPEAAIAEGEPDDLEITASLVRRNPPHHERAVLYLHGWSDYFFQTWMADFFDDLGHDFYAVELRRYGRGLREGMLGGYISDITEYFDELDRALAVVRAEGHEQVTVVAHSTGGLVASLWVNERPGQVHGLILNSPWLDLGTNPFARLTAGALLRPASLRGATRTLPLPDSGNYLRAIHADLDGEWDFDMSLKRHASFTIRPGWLAAIMSGHRLVRHGLHIDTPILSMMSARSCVLKAWSEQHQNADSVLDVDKLARRSVQLGPHVTVVRFDGGLHDLMLSRAEVREQVYAAIRTWMAAWL